MTAEYVLNFLGVGKGQKNKRCKTFCNGICTLMVLSLVLGWPRFDKLNFEGDGLYIDV